MTTTCSVVVDGVQCDKPMHTRGYCAMHWMRVKKSGDPGPVGKLKQIGSTGRPRKTDWQHGTAQGYQYHRCRCAACKQWRTDYNVVYRARRIANKTFKHGTEGYSCGCRCDVCDTSRRTRFAAWYGLNAAQAKANASRNGEVRRARQKNLAAYKVSERDWRRLCQRYDNCCAYCGERRPLQREHVIPVTRGGQHSIGNLLPSCKRCNLAKGTKLLVEWRKS